ncbi:MAG: hypothetical protein JXB42_00170 [Deltaproteobacteria bacterium]|nr:hypothetical protein [Deltaproteobacteria bacterium]
MNKNDIDKIYETIRREMGWRSMTKDCSRRRFIKRVIELAEDAKEALDRIFGKKEEEKG